MTENTSMAISLGIFGATATYLFAAYGGDLSLWAAFVSWACFFHSGGGLRSLKLTTACTIFGCVLGWLTMLMMTGASFGLRFSPPVWASMCVLVSAPIAVFAGRLNALSVVPTTMSALACVAAFANLKGVDMSDAVGSSNLLSLSLAHNALFNIVLSMLIGVGFGVATERMAMLFSTSEIQPT